MPRATVRAATRIRRLRPTPSPAPRALDARPSRWSHPLASGGLAWSEALALHSETPPRDRRGPWWRPEDNLELTAEDSRTILEMRMVT